MAMATSILDPIAQNKAGIPVGPEDRNEMGARDADDILDMYQVQPTMNPVKNGTRASMLRKEFAVGVAQNVFWRRTRHD